MPFYQSHVCLAAVLATYGEHHCPGVCAFSWSVPHHPHPAASVSELHCRRTARTYVLAVARCSGVVGSGRDRSSLVTAGAASFPPVSGRRAGTVDRREACEICEGLLNSYLPCVYVVGSREGQRFLSFTYGDQTCCIVGNITLDVARRAP